MQDLFFDNQKRYCDQHGEYDSASYLLKGIKHTISCPICVQIKIDHDDKAQHLQLQKENQLAAIRAVINRAAIPPAFQSCTFDNYQIYAGDNQLKVMNNLRYFADNFAEAKVKNINGILAGSTGTGKTHLAAAIINVLINKGYTAVFATMSDITNIIKSSFNDKTKSKQSIIKQFVDIDLLIIDEAGISDKNFDRDEIFDIINRRYSLKHPTLLITNIIDELKTKIGHRVVSRMQQGKFIQIFNWEDFRTRAIKS